MVEYTVLLFGPASAAIGVDRVVVVASGQCDCRALVARLVEEHPALETMVQAGRLAVDHGFVANDVLIEPGAEIALVTMVSGG